MCGIAGLLAVGSGEAALRGRIEAMTAALRHRGPDDSDTWTRAEHGIALGQRRLSIIDLSPLGRQPMLSASGRYCITYNGEIYNFPALRRELENLGASFRGHSDTEVMLAGIEAWGLEPTLHKLQGMFAIGLWDNETRSLTLVRDRVGIKPLYWRPLDNGIAFASEPRALLLDQPRPALNPEAVSHYLRTNYVPAPFCIWQGLHKLEPGHLLRCGADGLETPRSWWRLEDAIAAEPRITQIEEADARLHALLNDAIRGHMLSDVPVGAFLSGGVDSSLVTALMQAQSSQPVRSFTIGYAESGYDESGAAEAVARHLGTQHTTLRVTPEDALACIPRMPEIYDEPFADASQIATYLVSRLTRQHVTVALSGDGGDEGFAGYNRHIMAARWQRMQGWPPALRGLLAGMLTMLRPGQWDALGHLLPAGIRPPQLGEKLAKLGSVLRAKDVESYYRPLIEQWPDAARVLTRPFPPLPLPAQADGEDLVAYLQRLDARAYLHDDVLTKVDRASMAVALESRVPLLDHRVLSFGLALPRHLKLPANGKWPLRRLLARHVPVELTDRPKSGFAVPISTWLRGPLRDWAEDLLSVQALEETGLLQAKPIRAAWAEHLSGRANRQYGLWGVLMLQAWQRHWLRT